ITLTVSTDGYTIRFNDGQIAIGGRTDVVITIDGDTWSVRYEYPRTYYSNHFVADGVFGDSRYVFIRYAGGSFDVPTGIISYTTKTTGTREIEVDLSDVGEFGDSLVTWEADEPGGTSIELEVKLN